MLLFCCILKRSYVHTIHCNVYHCIQLEIDITVYKVHAILCSGFACQLMHPYITPRMLSINIMAYIVVYDQHIISCKMEQCKMSFHCSHKIVILSCHMIGDIGNIRST